MDLLPADGPHAKEDSPFKLPVEALLRLYDLKLLNDVDEICVRQLKGALTNEVYECSWIPSSECARDESEDSPLGKLGNVQNKKRNQRRVVLVRLYGSGVENFFNRDDEIETFEAMSKAGQGPRLLGRFSTGRIEEFLHARTLTAKDLRNPNISSRIAVKLGEFHQLVMPGSREPRIWSRLRDWLAEALVIPTAAEFMEDFCHYDLEKEIENLEHQAAQFRGDIGFCHNDLQYGNIMMDDETSLITIIDYEYATYNPVAYDLANHFCEMAANYHTKTPHLLDFSKFPALKERQRFIQAYLGRSGGNVRALEVEQLSREIDFYALASHLHWGLWGLISHFVSKIDFDYLEYSRQRFNQYSIAKSAFEES